MGMLLHAGVPVETTRGLTRAEAAALVEGLNDARRREQAAQAAAAGGM